MIKKLIQPNRYMMTVLQLLLPVWIYLAWGSEWYWYALTFVFYFLYLCVGNNIGMHRFYSHRYFEMHKPVEYFVGWCACVAGLGSPLSYVATHIIHHRFYDTEKDLHGWSRGWKSVLYCFHRYIHPKDIIFTKNLTKLMQEYHFINDYYWLLVAGNAILFYLIGGWNVFLFCWALPASLTLWAVAVFLLLQHDQYGPSNTRSYMWFVWGETWHANHHADPSLEDCSLGQSRDWTYELSKLFANDQSNTNKKN